jgi:hypothetical protein
LEVFRQRIDSASTNGATKLWDSIAQAAAMLKEKYRGGETGEDQVPLRVVVLTDGKDTDSTHKPEACLKMLLESKIVLDAIMIGTDAENQKLMALTKLTNGLCFAPQNVNEALDICELETLLALKARPAIESSQWKQPGAPLTMIKLLNKARYTTYPGSPMSYYSLHSALIRSTNRNSLPTILLLHAFCMPPAPTSVPIRSAGDVYPRGDSRRRCTAGSMVSEMPWTRAPTKQRGVSCRYSFD